MYVMTVCRGDCGVAARIINLGVRCRCGQRHAPTALLSWKQPPVIIEYCALLPTYYLGMFRFDTKVLCGERQKFYSGATVIFRGSFCDCYGVGKYIFGALGRVVPLIPKPQTVRS
jgi:hypothetical protein